MLNQQIHIHSGDAQGRCNCQSSSQCLINKFTHPLEMCKGDRIIRVAVSAQSPSSRTNWKSAKEMGSSEWQSVLNQQVHTQTGNPQGRWNRQSSSQYSINKFTYRLEIRKMESSEQQSVLNQQVHVQAGNPQGRWNSQRGSQCLINKFTYILEMYKGDGIVRAAVSA